MKLVFLDDVPGVAHGGDVKNVKNGFARNYLIAKKKLFMHQKTMLKKLKKLNQT